MFILFCIIIGILPFQFFGFLVHYFGRNRDISSLVSYTILTPPLVFVVVAVLIIYFFATGSNGEVGHFILYVGGIALVIGGVTNAICASLMYLVLKKSLR